MLNSSDQVYQKLSGLGKNSKFSVVDFKDVQGEYVTLYLYDKKRTSYVNIILLSIIKKGSSIDDNITNIIKLLRLDDYNIDEVGYEEPLERLPEFINDFKTFQDQEYRDFCKMLERWKYEIINSFIVYKGRRNSNGPMESLNSRIKNIIHNSYGFKNFKRFRNKVMYSSNKNEPIK